jgi:hypothetical protein
MTTNETTLTGTAELLNKAIDALKAGKGPDCPEFKALRDWRFTEDARQDRQAAVEKVRKAYKYTEATILKAGPSGTSAGGLVWDLENRFGFTMERAVKIVSALEMAGKIDLEGSSTYVHTAFDNYPYPEYHGN